jgi:hypothetical protein
LLFEQAVSKPGLSVEVVEPPVLPPQGAAIEFEVRVPPSGEITLVARNLACWQSGTWRGAGECLIAGHVVAVTEARQTASARGYPRAVNLALQALVAAFATGKILVEKAAARASVSEVVGD